MCLLSTETSLNPSRSSGVLSNILFNKSFADFEILVGNYNFSKFMEKNTISNIFH